MLIAADTPLAWQEGPFARYFRYHFEDRAAGIVQRRVPTAGLLANNAAELRAHFARLVERGTPRQAAATYLAGWLGGQAGAVIGYAIAGSGAGFLFDPDALDWHFHPDGWPDRVEPVRLCRVLVLPGHPWSGRHGVETLADPAELHARTTDALVAACRPLIVALAGIGGAKQTNLWHEVADGIAGALVYQTTLPVTEAGIAAIRGLVEAPAPWRRKPAIARVETHYGAVCVMHKGGCCLAYTEAQDGEDEDPDAREFARLFPTPPGAPRYCNNCRLRPREESTRRQLWWREREWRNRLDQAQSA